MHASKYVNNHEMKACITTQEILVTQKPSKNKKVKLGWG